MVQRPPSVQKIQCLMLDWHVAIWRSNIEVHTLQLLQAISVRMKKNTFSMQKPRDILYLHNTVTLYIFLLLFMWYVHFFRVQPDFRLIKLKLGFTNKETSEILYNLYIVGTSSWMYTYIIHGVTLITEDGNINDILTLMLRLRLKVLIYWFWS